MVWFSRHCNTKTGALERSTTSLHGKLSDECVCSTSGFLSCIDDDIYLNPPTVLLATADKFTQVETLGQEALTNCLKLLEHTTRNLLGFGCDPLP